MVNNILYIHGMGGGADSRIPSILRDVFAHPESHCHPERSEGSPTRVTVVARTYDFDPEVAAGQIAGGVHLLDHFLRAGGDGLKHFRAVQELGADDKPEFVILQCHK